MGPNPSAAFYPDSDGEPVAESWIHFLALVDFIHKLRTHFADRADVHVAGNQFWYYQEGDPRQCVAPDLYVVFGKDKAPRRSWKTWEEHCVPSVIAEVTSLTTRVIDEGSKRGLYERMGVQEYWQFDPLDEYLYPGLRGFSLQAGSYVPIARRDDGAVYSEAMGVWMRSGRQRVEVVRPDGRAYITLDDAEVAESRLLRELSARDHELADRDRDLADRDRDLAVALARIAELEGRLKS